MRKLFCSLLVAVFALIGAGTAKADITPKVITNVDGEVYYVTPATMYTYYQEGWVTNGSGDAIESASYYGSKNGSNNTNYINPETEESGTKVQASGITIKNDAKRSARFYFTGAVKVAAFIGITGSSRTANITVYNASNNVEVGSKTGESYSGSGAYEMLVVDGLSSTETYYANVSSTGDLCFYAIKFWAEDIKGELVSDVTEINSVTINGKAISADDLATLISDKTIAIDEAYPKAPEVVFNTTRTVTYTEGDPKVSHAAITADVTESETTFDAVATIGGEVYTITVINDPEAEFTASSWNFSEWEKETITDKKTVDGLTVYADASNTVAIDGNNKTVDGVKYTQRLKLGGSASWDTPTRALSFKVDGPTIISIVMTSSSSTGTGRNLLVKSGELGSLTEIGSQEAPVDNVLSYSFEYKGTEATTIWIGASGGGINLYYIEQHPYTPAEDPQVATISAGGLTTFCAIESNVTIPEGVTAYAVVAEGDLAHLIEVEGTVLGQGEGFVLEGTPGETYAFEATTDAAASVAKNQMVGVVAEGSVPSGCYVLGVKDGVCTFGKWNGGNNFPAGKAYLNYSTPSGAPLKIVKGDATGIESVIADQLDADLYNVNGQKVDGSYKGLVIKKGQKMLNK